MSVAGTVTINMEDPTDRHRYSCPVGHRSWERTNDHFWCHSCAAHGWNRDPEFHALIDRKTRAELPRSCVRFL